MQEERYTEIDRENRILLQKMANIMKQPLSNSGPTTPREPRSLSAVPPRSLNSNARKKELLRITKENQMILKRIQQAQPVYNHVEWEGLNRRNLAYLKNSAEYPLVLRSARGGRTAELTRLDGIDQGGTMSARSAPLPESSARRAPGRADGTSRLVLSGKMVLDVEGAGAASGQTTFLVKMLTDGRSLRISVLDEDSQVALDLAVSETSHRKLLSEANGDYSRIAQSLQVLGGRLVLDAPAAVQPVLAQQPLVQQQPLPQRAWQPAEELEETPSQVEPEVVATAPKAKTPTPPPSRPASRGSGPVAVPSSRRSSGQSQTRPALISAAKQQDDDELDAAGMCRAKSKTPTPPPSRPSSRTPTEEMEETSSQAEAAAAATRIQSMHRGKVARRQVAQRQAERQLHAAADREAAAVRAELARQEDAAAIRIQSIHRGKAARRRAAEEAQKRAAPAEAAPAEAAAAATRIQSMHRGKVARRQVAQRHAERQSQALAETPEAKTPTPPPFRNSRSARPNSRLSGRRSQTRPTSSLSTATQEDDELDAGPCRGSVLQTLVTRRGLHAEVNITYDPPETDECADVKVLLRGTTPSPDILLGRA